MFIVYLWKIIFQSNCNCSYIVIVIRLDGSVPVKYGLRLNIDEKYGLLKSQLSALCGIPPFLIKVAELSGAQIKVIIIHFNFKNYLRCQWKNKPPIYKMYFIVIYHLFNDLVGPVQRLILWMIREYAHNFPVSALLRV